jgi:hypothetical protein
MAPMACRKTISAGLSVLVLATGAALAADQAAHRPEGETKQTRYLRLVRDKDEAPVALEVAIVRCAPADRGRRAPTVDLVGAVHVAEKSFYRHLNGEFRKYDAVLYELVAPEGTRVPKDGAGGSSPVSALQRGMTNVLELSFQLNEIDYSRKNMVHADMSPEQFAKSMRRRGESVFGMFLRMMGYAIARQQGSSTASDGQLLLALFDKNRALALKRILAEQFEDLEGSLLAMEGPDGSTMISERNKVAIGVLRKQLAAGRKKIAVFYGAGHMADFQQRLRDELGLVPISTRWLVAWNLKPDNAAEPAAETGGK